MVRWFAHLEIKLMCLLLALGLWFYVTHLRQGMALSSEPTLSTLHLLDVPVQLKGATTAQWIPEPPVIHITVQWRIQDPVQYSALDEIYAVIPTDTVDSNEPTTAIRYELKSQDFVLPPGWRLIEVTPKQVTLKPTSTSPE